MMTDEYITIAAEATALFKDRNSKFIGLVYPIQSEEEVKPIIDALKKQHYDANHHCYAYIIKPDKSVSRSSDDGEPSGSAGKPMMNQLLSVGVTNVLAVVVRYFGGTKLGVPGLIHAYKTAIKMALDEAELKTIILSEPIKIEIPYERFDRLMYFLNQEQIDVAGKEFTDRVILNLAVRQSRRDFLLEKLKEMQIKVW